MSKVKYCSILLVVIIGGVGEPIVDQAMMMKVEVL